MKGPIPDRSRGGGQITNIDVRSIRDFESSAHVVAATF